MSKKIFIFIVINLFFYNLVNSSEPNYYFGKGDLNLSNKVVSDFTNYIKKNLSGKKGDEPITFWVTEDGENSYWWTSDGNSCSRTWDNEIYIVSRGNVITFGVQDVCRGRQHIRKFGKECTAYHKQECKLFARNRTIIWNNGINEGAGKKSKINSRWDDQKIITTLTDLGFLGGLKVNTKLTTEKKEIKIENFDQKFYGLLDLYETGVLSKEELLQAAKKMFQ